MQTSKLEIVLLGELDIEEVAALVKTVFDQYVGPLYSEEGIQEFYRYIHPQAFAARLHHQHLLLGAKQGQDIVGIIEIRHSDHISLLFVSSACQRQGVATRLFARTVEICKQESPEVSSISVNASPNAVPSYERMGFSADTGEQEVHGIRFTPMTYDLTQTPQR